MIRGEIMKTIRNNQDYENALNRIEELIDIDPEQNTELADELEVLSLLIEKYEDDNYPIESCINKKYSRRIQ